MNRMNIVIRSKTLLSKFIPDVFKSAIKLLDPKARALYLILSFLQIILAIFEVIALGALTVMISIGLSNFTSISKQKELNTGLFYEQFANLNIETQIAALFGTYVLCTVAKTFLSGIVTFSSLKHLAKQTVNIGFRLNLDLFKHGINQIRFGKSQENLMSVTGSLDALLIGYLGTFSQLLGDLATILMVALALTFFDFETSLLLFTLFALLLIFLHFSVNKVSAQLGQKVALSTAKLNRRILDSWLVYREVLLAQREEEVLKPTLFERSEVAISRAKLSFLPNLSKYIFEIFLVFFALIVAAVQLWINGLNEAVSSFVLIAAASARLMPVTLRLQGNFLAIKKSAGIAVFAIKLLEEVQRKPEMRNSLISSVLHKTDFNAAITVTNLSFTYPDSTKNTIHNISLSITPGTFTAITGASGSGKSTLIDLILGFLEPTTGTVLVSGAKPSDARLIWPGKIAYVPQEVQIFEGSLLENITLSTNGEYDETNLVNCIKSSGLLEDFGDLSNGIHTHVGERGFKLSGGQKQRLGIARALYNDPKLLVFDEATSALDPITENKVSKSVFQRIPNRTVIVVAHRLSTVMNADVVFYLKNGKVKASGKFSDLKNSEPEFLKQAELSGL